MWLLAIAASKHLKSIEGAGGASAAIGATFGNMVLLGIPLSVSFFGEAAALPAGLIVSIHAPIQWTVATLRAETTGQNTGKSITATLFDLFLSLIKNPIVVAICAGSLWRLTGLGLNPLLDRTIGLLGQAGVPAALFVLGLSLTSFAFKGNIRGVMVLLLLKLAVFPVLTAFLAFYIFDLAPVYAGVAILFACMPTGVNAYLFAAKYDTGVAPVSGAIAIGTAISIFTVSLVLWLVAP